MYSHSGTSAGSKLTSGPAWIVLPLVAAQLTQSSMCSQRYSRCFVASRFHPVGIATRSKTSPSRLRYRCVPLSRSATHPKPTLPAAALCRRRSRKMSAWYKAIFSPSVMALARASSATLAASPGASHFSAATKRRRTSSNSAFSSSASS